MTRFVALLRAVNVGGRKLPMAELRALCGALGWSEVVTYIQSGNVVFAASGRAAGLEAELEAAVADRFGFHSDVIVRSARSWPEILASNPFEAQSRTEPNRVLAGLAKARLRPDAAAVIAAKAAQGERVEQSGETLWFHYPAGVGTSKITPKLIDRAAGSPVTTRNWTTMLRLGEMLEE